MTSSEGHTQLKEMERPTMFLDRKIYQEEVYFLSQVASKSNQNLTENNNQFFLNKVILTFKWKRLVKKMLRKKSNILSPNTTGY